MESRARGPERPAPDRPHPCVGHRRRRGRRGPVRHPARDLRRLHGVGPQPVVPRGLHPRRGAAAVREHAHRVVGHRAPDHALPRGGAAARPRGRGREPRGPRRDLLRLRARPPRSTAWSTSSTCASRRTSTTRWDLRVADPARAAAGRVHRPVRAPQQRAAVARVHRRRRHDPRGPRRATSTWPSSREELERYADRPLKIGSFSAASNVTGIVSDTYAISRLLHEHGALSFFDFAAAAPYIAIEMDPPQRPARVQGRGVHHRPTSSSAGRGRPGCWSPAASCSGTGCRRCPAAAPSSTSTRSSTSTCPTSSTARRAGRPRSSSRSGPGSCSRSRRPWGSRRSASGSTRSSSGRCGAGRRTPSIEILGSHEADRLSIVSFVVRHDGKYLHHNFVVALLNDLFGIQSRGGCSCAGPYGHRLLGIDLETSPRVRARDRARLRGDQARLGPGQLQLLHQRGRVRVHPRRRGPRGDRRLAAAAATTRSSRRRGLWRHRAGRPEPPRSLRDVTLRRRPAWPGPSHRHREPESRLADYLVEGRAILDRPAVAAARRRRSTRDAVGPGLRGAPLVPAPGGRRRAHA